MKYLPFGLLLAVASTLTPATGAQPAEPAPAKSAPAEPRAKPTSQPVRSTPAEKPVAPSLPERPAQEPPAKAAPAKKQSASRDLVGRAGPSTRAGTTPHALELRPGLEVFAQYALRNTKLGPTTGASESDWFHEFEVPRVHAALTAEYEGALGRVVLEGVRSASDGALIGVAGNSIVLRLREAYAGYRYEFSAGALEVRGGLIPTLAVPELEGTWTLRAVTPSPEERTGLLAPVDLGVTVRYELPSDYGWVGVAAYNGDGYLNRELNRGKNTEFAAAIHPVPNEVLKPLALFAAYQVGSSGTGRARNDRLTAALLWQGALVRAGASFNYAFGLRDDGDQTSYLIDGFARVEPVERLILGTRAAYWVRDTRSDVTAGQADSVFTVVATVGYQIADPLQSFLAFTWNQPTERARAALPGLDGWELSLIGRVLF